MTKCRNVPGYNYNSIATSCKTISEISNPKPRRDKIIPAISDLPVLNGGVHPEGKQS